MGNLKKTKRRIKYKNVLLVLALIFIFIYTILYTIDFKLRNIYVLNHNVLNDQYIIDLAGINNYPSVLKISSKSIKKKLESDTLINKAKIYKKGLFDLYIDIEENKPLFYYSSESSTVLLDKSKVNEKYNVLNVINYIPDTIYDKFVDCISALDESVINKISEIKYDPNEVDEERFLITMSDGNYVYINIRNFKSMNDYIDIVSKFNNINGILYLDSGEYFEKIK